MKDSIPIYTKGKTGVTHAVPATKYETKAIDPIDIQPEVLPKGEARCTAKTAKVTLVIDPSSLTRVDSIGKKQIKLVVSVGTMKFNAMLNSKGYRKALVALDEFGIDGCSIILQATMSTQGKLESCGLAVQPKKEKVSDEKASEEVS